MVHREEAVAEVRGLALNWLAMANRWGGVSDVDAARLGIGGVTLVAARALAVLWDWMQVTRALFPLTGFILGGRHEADGI